jgi:enoyl-CoA hydratase/carnithine racemase
VSVVETSIDGHVALCRLNRPEARNALSPELMDELATAVEGFDADPGVRCVVIAGSDDVFASGADIRALRERSFEETLRHPAAAFWRRLAACRTPIVAAVSGWALGGGCELALLCDLIVASETAEFGQPEITLGIIPGGGGTQRLARVAGKQRAMDLVLTGRRIGAREAERLGLVNCVVPAGELEAQVKEWSTRLAEGPAKALSLTKTMLNDAYALSFEQAIEQESRSQYILAKGIKKPSV